MESKGVSIAMTAPGKPFLMVWFVKLCNVALTFDPFSQIVKCGYSNESY